MSKKSDARLSRLVEASKKKPRERYLIVSARVRDEKVEARVKEDLQAGVSPSVLLNEALEHYYATSSDVT